jgi:Icc protein
MNWTSRIQTLPLNVVQITDTHLFEDVPHTLKGCVTAETLARVLQQVQSLKPQPNLLLLTGDLSQDETPASYGNLRDLLDPLQIPAYWIPGNHDHLSTMEDLLKGGVFFPDKTIQAGGWQIILLNSQVLGQTAGQLSQSSLAELDQHLSSYPELPTLIALHHPPCQIASPWMDELGLQNSADLYAVIDRHPQVRLVIFGHIHQEFSTIRHQVTYLGCPSTCIQFTPFSTSIELDDKSPGFRQLTLYPNGHFETQIIRLS